MRSSLAVLGIGVALAVAGADAWLTHDESTWHLRVECAGDRCAARLGDGAPVEVAAPAGDRAGLYVFHATEFGGPQVVESLSIEAAEGALPGGVRRLEPALRDRRALAAWRAGPGWRVEPGRGLTHEGAVRAAGVALLDVPLPDRYVVRATIVDGQDAGVLVRATGLDDGLLFIARRAYNDLFACRLEDGRPGPVLGLVSLGEPRLGREILRVAGLAARLILIGLAVAFALRGIAVRGRPLREAPGGGRRAAPAWCLGLLFAATIAGASWVALDGLGNVSHIDDESAYLFQARVFAAGSLWAPAPAAGDADFFRHQHMIMRDGRWFSKYPPLWPAVLTLGVLVGAPWLVNPVLTALTGLVMYLLGRELAGWRWGVVAWLLALVSPFVMLMGGSLMSHPLTALLVTVASWCTVRSARTGRAGPALAAGVALGGAFLTRPYTAALAGLAFGVWLLLEAHGAEARRRALVPALVVFAGMVPFAAAYAGWNALLTGGGSIDLYTAYDAADRLGFGPDRGAGWWMSWGSWGHTPAKGLRSIWLYLDSTAMHLLGWPLATSFAPVVAALVWGRRRGIGLPVLLALALLGGHALYWAVLFVGYGARYWYAAVPGVLVVSALGVRALLLPAGGPPRRGAAVVAAVLAALVGWNAAAYLPARWTELGSYGGTTADLRRTIDERGLDDALVFVWTEGLLYNEGFGMNDPFLRRGCVFARDLGPRNAELAERYPGRTTWRWTRERRLVPLAVGGERTP